MMRSSAINFHPMIDGVAPTRTKQRFSFVYLCITASVASFLSQYPLLLLLLLLGLRRGFRFIDYSAGTSVSPWRSLLAEPITRVISRTGLYTRWRRKTITSLSIARKGGGAGEFTRRSLNKTSLKIFHTLSVYF